MIMVQGMVMRMPRGMIVTTKTDPMMINGLGDTGYMFSIMGSITLPFMPWSSGRITSKDEGLQADISGLSLERKNMEGEMVSELNASLKKLESKRDQVRLYENDVLPIYKKALEAQLVEYRNNRLSINSLLETMRRYL